MAVHFSKEGFDKALAQGGLMMVDFWADWCGPCKMLSPVIEDLAGQYEGKALVGKVNVDEEQELAMRYGVMSIPTVIFFKDGKEIDRKVGVSLPEHLPRYWTTTSKSSSDSLPGTLTGEAVCAFQAPFTQAWRGRRDT